MACRKQKYFDERCSFRTPHHLAQVLVRSLAVSSEGGHYHLALRQFKHRFQFQLNVMHLAHLALRQCQHRFQFQLSIREAFIYVLADFVR